MKWLVESRGEPGPDAACRLSFSWWPVQLVVGRLSKGGFAIAVGDVLQADPCGDRFTTNAVTLNIPVFAHQAMQRANYLSAVKLLFLHHLVLHA